MKNFLLISILMIGLKSHSSEPEFQSEFKTELRYAVCRWNSVCDRTKSDFESSDEIMKFASPFAYINENNLESILYFINEHSKAEEQEINRISNSIAQAMTPIFKELNLKQGHIIFSSVGEFTSSYSMSGKRPELMPVESAEWFYALLEIEVRDSSKNLIAQFRSKDETLKSISKKYLLSSHTDGNLTTQWKKEITNIEFNEFIESHPIIIHDPSANPNIQWVSDSLVNLSNSMVASACQLNPKKLAKLDGTCSNLYE